MDTKKGGIRNKKGKEPVVGEYNNISQYMKYLHGYTNIPSMLEAENIEHLDGVSIIPFQFILI